MHELLEQRQAGLAAGAKRSIERQQTVSELNAADGVLRCVSHSPRER
ncbi:MAG: hypothetical protein ACREUT_08230 [Steroidobacteraceae bacterium]